MIEFLSSQSLLVLFLTIALGYWLGSFSIKGLSLGSGAVLFVGLAFGAYVPKAAPVGLVGSLGLLLFLYGVGIAYGAQFFRGLTSPLGLKANAAALIGLSISTILMILAIKFVPHVQIAEALGAFAGSGTSTAALQAAIAANQSTLPATGYSVAYPFGVAVPIIVLGLYNSFFKPSFPKQQRISLSMYAVRLENTFVENKTLMEIDSWLPEGVNATTVSRNGITHSAEVHGKLKVGDIILISGVDKSKLNEAVKMLGEQVGDEFHRQQGGLDYLRLFVSNPKVVGKTIKEIKEMMDFEVSILHVRRVDEDISVSGQLKLEIGDQIGVLADLDHIPNLRQVFGDSVRANGELSFLSIGIGAALGLAVGAVPLNLPSLGKFSLGFAGLLLVALLLGKQRRTGKFVWSMPVPANNVLRNFGLTLFLAQVGLSSGQTFVQTVAESGFLYVFLGIILVLVMSLITLFVAIYLFDIPFDLAAGIVSGVTGNPAILSFSTRTTDTEKPDIGYAMIFPSMTVIKIIIVQVIGAIGL